LIREGQVKKGSMKDINIHSVADDETMVQLGASTKGTPTAGLLSQLKMAGQIAMDGFLDSHANALGKEASCDLKAMFS